VTDLVRRDRVEVGLIGGDAVFRIEIKVESGVEANARVGLSQRQCIRIDDVGNQPEGARVGRSCARVGDGSESDSCR